MSFPQADLSGELGRIGAEDVLRRFGGHDGGSMIRPPGAGKKFPHPLNTASLLLVALPRDFTMALTFVSFGLGVVLMSVLTMSLPARAASVGEVHRVASESTAATRDEGHRTELRITIWYPASTDAVEAPVIIGPPAAPLFDVGTAAANARFVGLFWTIPSRPALIASILNHLDLGID